MDWDDEEEKGVPQHNKSMLSNDKSEIGANKNMILDDDNFDKDTKQGSYDFDPKKDLSGNLRSD